MILRSSSAAIAAALFLGGCGSCREAPGPADAGPPPSASAAASAPDLGLSAWPWASAAAGDDHALARIADEHTAPELMAIAGRGPYGDTALAAIARAADAEAVLGELAVLARDPERGDVALRTILAVASRPPRRSEPLDPESMRRCIDALDAISRDDSVSRARRVLAVNALRAFVRGGYLSAESVTTELDD